MELKLTWRIVWKKIQGHWTEGEAASRVLVQLMEMYMKHRHNIWPELNSSQLNLSHQPWNKLTKN